MPRKQNSKKPNTEIGKLKKELAAIDSCHYYSHFQTKEAYAEAYNAKTNIATRFDPNGLLKALVKQDHKDLIINNKKLINETFKNQTIHNLIFKPIENTNLSCFAGVCYNKNIGKSMETSLLLQIAKDVGTLTVKVDKIEKTVNLQQKELAEVKKNMATKKELAEVKKNMATKKELAEVKKNMATKKELAEVKKDVSELKQDVSALKQDVSALKQDLKQTKIKNNLK